MLSEEGALDLGRHARIGHHTADTTYRPQFSTRSKDPAVERAYLLRSLCFLLRCSRLSAATEVAIRGAVPKPCSSLSEVAPWLVGSTCSVFDELHAILECDCDHCGPEEPVYADSTA